MKYVKEIVFDDNDDEDPDNLSNKSHSSILTSRESTSKKVLAKRKRKGATAGIFAPVSGDGKLKFP